ncbi:MAG: hypothetical protein JOZ31_07340 [Verrucomicrobia bacterium]|nr:hypothetical protein [Verrucomicrobiota bacterium]
MRPKGRDWLVSGCLFVVLVLGAEPKASAQLTILHNFGDGTVPNDGAVPIGGLVLAPDGRFYGATLFSAATSRSGSVFFQMTRAGALSIVASFKWAYAIDTPIYYNGELIGTRINPHIKSAHPGLLYALTPNSSGPWNLERWHVFGPPPAGRSPLGRLIPGADGNLYGITYQGGSAKYGTIYKVDPSTHQVTFVYSFTGPSPAISPNTTLLLANDGNFYGGTGAFPGEIYKMTAAGQVTTVYQFSGTEYPTGPLIQGSDGNFYGTAAGGPSDEEYVFQLTIGGVATVLHTFKSRPHMPFDTQGLIQGPNGNLYGLTVGGGTANWGTVYELSTDGSSFNVLHNFDDGSIQNDGRAPVGILTVGPDKNLYGETQSGGSAGKGTLFRISP